MTTNAVPVSHWLHILTRAAEDLQLEWLIGRREQRDEPTYRPQHRGARERDRARASLAYVLARLAAWLICHPGDDSMQRSGGQTPPPLV